MTGKDETDACEVAVAESDVARGGATGDGDRQEMAISMRALWPAGVVDSGAEEGEHQKKKDAQRRRTHM